MSLLSDIGDFLGGAARAVLPGLGTVFGGPVLGGIVGRAVTPPTAPQLQPIGFAAPGGLGFPTFNPAVFQPAMGRVAPVIRQAAPVIAGAMGLELGQQLIGTSSGVCAPTCPPGVSGAIRTGTGRISGFCANGKRVSIANAMSCAKRLGLPATAAALGVDEATMGMACLQKSRRRARGLSARDISNARRTIRRIKSFDKALKKR